MADLVGDDEALGAGWPAPVGTSMVVPVSMPSCDERAATTVRPRASCDRFDIDGDRCAPVLIPGANRRRRLATCVLGLITDRRRWLGRREYLVGIAGLPTDDAVVVDRERPRRRRRARPGRQPRPPTRIQRSAARRSGRRVVVFDHEAAIIAVTFGALSVKVEWLGTFTCGPAESAARGDHGASRIRVKQSLGVVAGVLAANVFWQQPLASGAARTSAPAGHGRCGA